MKIAIALWVIEKRPYLFRMPLQILLCALAGGLAFALIENLMYLHVYIPGQLSRPGGRTASRIRGRVACVALDGLHRSACHLFVLRRFGTGQMWSHAIASRTRPKLAHAAPMIMTAMIGHGLYNGIVSIAEAGGWLEF